MISIIGVGDIMPGGLLTDNNQPCANNDVLNFLLQGDIRCGTFECALGNEPTYDLVKVADRGNVIYAKENDIRRLKELYIDIVSLANNHFFDLGVNGYKRTIELLENEGIKHCGAGANIEEASRPAVIEKDGKTFAFLAFCDTEYKNVFWCTYATTTQPGVNPMIENHVKKEIEKNKRIYDYIIVLAHWGREYTYYPNDSTCEMVGIMQTAGASLILGSHPHRIQSVVNKRNCSIAYSMGNFLFPERLIAPPKVTYYPDTPIDYSTLPVTDKYPIVDCVTLKTLPYLARVGMIVTSEIENHSIKSSYVLSYLNNDNCIEFLGEEKAAPLKRKIDRMGLFLKWNCYSVYKKTLKLRNLFSRIKRRIINCK